MSVSVTSLSGEMLLIADKAFEDGLKKIIRNRVTEKSEQERIYRILIDSPYVLKTSNSAALLNYKRQKNKKAQNLLKKFVDDLINGSIEQIIPSVITGRPEFTKEKLHNHSLRCLEIEEKYLLIKIERHPTGGGSKILQYWMYLLEEKKLHLLSFNPIIPEKISNWSVRNSAKRLDFEKKAKSLLGHKALEKIDALSMHQNFILLEDVLPPVIEEASRIVGHEFALESPPESEIDADHIGDEFLLSNEKNNIMLVPTKE